jgi:hypothetical protein
VLLGMDDHARIGILNNNVNNNNTNENPFSTRRFGSLLFLLCLFDAKAGFRLSVAMKRLYNNTLVKYAFELSKIRKSDYFEYIIFALTPSRV